MSEAKIQQPITRMSKDSTPRLDVVPMRLTTEYTYADRILHTTLLDIVREHNADGLLSEALEHGYGQVCNGDGREYNIDTLLCESSRQDLGGNIGLKRKLIRAFVPLQLAILRPIQARFLIIDDLYRAQCDDGLKKVNLSEFGEQFFENLYQEAASAGEWGDAWCIANSMRLDGSGVVRGLDSVYREPDEDGEGKRISLNVWINNCQQSLPKYAEQILAQIKFSNQSEYLRRFLGTRLKEIDDNELNKVFHAITERDWQVPFNKRDQLSKDVVTALMETIIRKGCFTASSIVDLAMRAQMPSDKLREIAQKLAPEPADPIKSEINKALAQIRLKMTFENVNRALLDSEEKLWTMSRVAAGRMARMLMPLTYVVELRDDHPDQEPKEPEYHLKTLEEIAAPVVGYDLPEPLSPQEKRYLSRLWAIAADAGLDSLIFASVISNMSRGFDPVSLGRDVAIYAFAKGLAIFNTYRQDRIYSRKQAQK